ncbi:unnamed protein product [Aureobasidium uvarum]|uniref:separase n=1 Tax=Aureobasidium uvarum TaxID=2773716 RepID=A0A9N8KII0_9PEZI|nr:unnamed protein product [Aureobasidium uvarum]
MPPMTSPAEVVRKALATPSSCSPTTTSTLQTLLASSQDQPKPSKTPAKTTATRKPPPTRTTRTKPVPAAVPDAPQALTASERYKLATDVVNVSLKVLNDATKASTSSPSQSPSTKRPLSSGLNTVAECARIAFAHLRSARSSSDDSLQLETGMLALCSKLVALGMDTLAMKELRILKTCIHRRSGGASPAPASERETLATLLHLECRTCDAKVLSLAISYHMSVLRLVVNSGRPATIDASLPHLMLDNPISAAALLLRSRELSEDNNKVARQLDTLSKLILSMCPSPSSSADDSAANVRTSASPDVAFKLQTTALLIQTKWWPIAGHKADLQKELFEPLVRYMDAYRRRAEDREPQAYKQAINCISTLVGLDRPKSDTLPLPLTLYKALSALAVSFGMQDEALRYTEFMSSTSEKGPGNGMTLFCTVRSMALCLDRDDQPDLAILSSQVQSCRSHLVNKSGSSTLSVDDMLVELARLRKTTIRILTHDTGKETGPEPDECAVLLCTISFLCTETLLWCLESTADAKALGDVASKLVVPFVSSSIFSCKLLVSSCEHVKAVHEALEICTRLLDLNSDSEAEHLVVNISNLHWRCFQLLASKTGESSPEAIRCLQASIDILRERSSVHQEAGFLGSKLERFGGIAKSCSVFAETISIQLRSGVLHELTQNANSKSLSSVLQLDRKAQLLRRILHEHHTSAAKDSASVAFFDDDLIDPLERATLLEIQLAFFEEDLFKPSHRRRGLRTEASYYLEQADILVARVDVPHLRTKISVQREAQAYIEGIETDTSVDNGEPGDSIDLVKLGIIRGDIFAADEETWESAQQEYEKAEAMATRLAGKNFVERLGVLKVPPDKSNVTKTAPVRNGKRTVTKTPTIRVPPAKTPKSTTTKVKTTIATIDSNQENVPLSSLCAAALRQRGLLLINQGETDLGLELLEQAEAMKHDPAQEILQQLAMAEGLLRKFGDELALDFTFNVLPESTISFPALSTTTGKKPSTQTSLSSTPMSLSNATTPKKNSRQKRTDEEFARFLCDAQERLVNIQRRSASTAGMSVFHQLCGLGSKAMLLLSALNASMSLSGSLHPTRAACSIEMSRIEAFSRELNTIEAEKEYMDYDARLATQSSTASSSHLSAARFQKDYIDIIPNSWAAVSVTLSEDHNELYIARYRANQAPFLLRLPMTRNKMQDIEDDEESPTFDFESGKAELQEIIELSNYSCSKPPSAMTQEAKQSWWDEREALDLRMQELIVNIENIWLGGFKGVLSQHRKDPALLARFRKSLDGILDRHLPSRQSTKSKAKKLVLHANIVELFVGLGDDQDGEIDMDEQVLDLLYFVIDILQFNGERNAYDEVDFDVMATETMDALRSYHEAANFNAADQNHLILILDRKLHAFPWESLPCLQNVSVSRVGSMLTLRERILAMRSQMKDNAEEKYFVNKQSGAFILNPSGDLSRTQTTMSPLLDSLRTSSGSSWQSTINKIPSEKDFASVLSEKSTLLYFGHGSGNQYIRNRTIKKLDKCAEVVWLMGCSSGTVTEHGDYEPTSVPLSYLVAGKRQTDTLTDEESKYRNDNREGLCMAVVATLWDVTDKDIDRFAVKTGEHWGLWSSAP